MLCRPGSQQAHPCQRPVLGSQQRQVGDARLQSHPSADFGRGQAVGLDFAADQLVQMLFCRFPIGGGADPAGDVGGMAQGFAPELLGAASEIPALWAIQGRIMGPFIRVSFQPFCGVLPTA